MAAFPEGAPCWVDAMVPDLEAGKRFYGELFGWTFDQGEADYGHYTQALRDGQRVAALYPVPEGMEGMPPAWSLYFASDDIERTAGRIREHGGEVVTEPMQVGPHGSMMTAKDPGGAVFGVWQAGAHEGFERQYQPGSFGWAEISVRETKGVDAFYPAVFPIEPVAYGDDSVDFVVWQVAGKPVAGRFKLPEGTPDSVPPHAMVYFVVDDCDGAVGTVRRLGGAVRVDPQDSPYGRFAIVEDQQGAAFSVIDPRTTVGEPEVQG
ncbi:VOC family protein [Streptomyces sp. NPDC047108]|uniref:VOC family protein n=1 Tax=Streptomyces sp. NPDC047108 TaxID=3155025 RepID=UPI0033C0D9CA